MLYVYPLLLCETRGPKIAVRGRLEAVESAWGGAATVWGAATSAGPQTGYQGLRPKGLSRQSQEPRREVKPVGLNKKV